MKAMILGMCILSHKTQCFLMFGHVVDVGAGKRRGLPVINYILNIFDVDIPNHFFRTPSGALPAEGARLLVQTAMPKAFTASVKLSPAS